MNMGKKLLTLSILGLATSQIQAAPLNDARSAGRAGTGIALGDLRSITLNPAALATADDAYFSMGINVGAFVSDPGDLIDDVDDIQDDLDQFEHLVDNLKHETDPGQIASLEGNAETIKDSLINNMKKLNRQGLKLEAGGTPLVIAIPTKHVKLALSAKVNARASAGFIYDSSDDGLLQEMIDNKNPDGLDNMASGVELHAVGVADIGIAYAHRFDTQIGQLDFGTTVKQQRLYAIERTLSVREFDEDDIFDRDKHSKEKDGINLDVGIVQHFNNSNWRFAATAENLIARKISTPDSGRTYKLSPQVTVGGAYDLGWFKFEANTELLKNNGFGTVKETQILRAGVEFGHRKIAQFRLGYVHDYKNNQADLFTVGFGLSPWDVFNIDLAAMVGKDDTMGAAVGLGLKF